MSRDNDPTFEFGDLEDEARFDDDFDDDGFGDCAMMPDGQRGKAGSEECDWECPVMIRQIRREAAKIVAKKAKRK